MQNLKLSLLEIGQSKLVQIIHFESLILQIEIFGNPYLAKFEILTCFEKTDQTWVTV